MTEPKYEYIVWLTEPKYEYILYSKLRARETINNRFQRKISPEGFLCTLHQNNNSLKNVNYYLILRNKIKNMLQFTDVLPQSNSTLMAHQRLVT